MDKPLFPKGKDESTAQADSRWHAQSPDVPNPNTAPSATPAQSEKVLSGASMGAYGPQANQQIELNKKIWEESAKNPKNVPWMSDPKSRLAVRMFSRGIMGAAFFTAGGMLQRKWMVGEYDVEKSLLEQKNPLQFIAKLVDTGVGKPIEAATLALTGSERKAKKAVLFRSTYYINNHVVDGRPLWGRSLGHEVVDVTFDFFCASVGDAIGRDIAGYFDPNVKKDWIDDKGHIKPQEAVNTAGKALWRYMTYNGGEDWAVSIPYVYFMKGQREWINRMSPGWKYDFDQTKHGGSFKVGGNPFKPDGTVDPHHVPSVTGNYALEGILDFQSRFTVYNIGTLMYRELYDHVSNFLHGKPDRLYGAPDAPEQPGKGLLAKTGDVMKWMARSAIKGLIIMTPSVPFFWITRTNQHKHRGLFIHPEHGMMSRKKNDDPANSHFQPVAVSDYFYALKYKDDSVLKKDVYYSQFNRKASQFKGIPYERVGPMDPYYANPSMWRDPSDPHKPGLAGTSFHPYRQQNSLPDRLFNSLGQGQYEVTHSLTHVAESADQHLGGIGQGIKNKLGGFGPENKGSFTYFTGPFSRASMSYTPYMYAKAEFANLWDSGKVDLAAERLIDGASSLNWKEVKAGAGEIFNAILYKPFADPEREVEAQRRIVVDTSAPEIFNDEQFKDHKKTQMRGLKKNEAEVNLIQGLEEQSKQNTPLSWRERVVSAKPEVAGAKDREDKDTRRGIQKSGSYSDQESMRKVLEELNPPTNAVH